MAFESFKSNEVVLIDPQNTMNLSGDDPIFGKIIKRVGMRTYEVDLLIYSNTDGEYISSDNTVLLTTDQLGRVNGSGTIIRTPISHPIVNQKDIIAITNIIKMYEEGEKSRYEDITRMKLFLNKITHFKRIFEDGEF